jgi:hypothetical protein
VAHSSRTIACGPLGYGFTLVLWTRHTTAEQLTPSGIIGKKRGSALGRSGVLDRGYADFREVPF